MKEWAILAPTGEVVNMAMTQGDPPRQVPRGHTVKPVEDVPRAVLERYKFWNERP